MVPGAWPVWVSVISAGPSDTHGGGLELRGTAMLMRPLVQGSQELGSPEADWQGGRGSSLLTCRWGLWLGLCGWLAHVT